MQIPSKVQVRPGVKADLRALTDIYNHYVRETALTFDTVAFTRDERPPWLRSHPEDGPHRLLVASDPDTRHDAPYVLGYATSSPYRPKAAYSTSVEVSVYCAPGTTGPNPAPQGPGRSAELHRALRQTQPEAVDDAAPLIELALGRAQGHEQRREVLRARVGEAARR